MLFVFRVRSFYVFHDCVAQWIAHLTSNQGVVGSTVAFCPRLPQQAPPCFLPTSHYPLHSPPYTITRLHIVTHHFRPATLYFDNPFLTFPSLDPTQYQPHLNCILQHQGHGVAIVPTSRTRASYDASLLLE